MKIVVFKVAITVINFLISVDSAKAQQFSCYVERKELCQNNVSCRKIDNTMVLKIDLERSSYSRCENNRCQAYEVAISNSGQFVNLSGGYHGLLAKLDTLSNELLEVATLGLNTFVTFAKCKQS